MYTTPSVRRAWKRTYDIQQLSGSSGRGSTLIPSTIRICSGWGAGLAAGPARRDPKMIFPTGGVGDLPAPVVRADSLSNLDAMTCLFSSSSSACTVDFGNRLDDGLERTGCCIDTRH